VSGGVTTTYTYNADGARVKRAMGSATTYYIGNWFEVTQAGAVTKYYYFGGKRVAVRQSGTPYYLHTDHLGSTSITTDASRNQVGSQTYYTYGAVRTSSGALQTDYTFTGQRLDADAGLLYYGARYYDWVLGRFISADTLVADWYNPQLLNRFAYVRNNPVNLTDPTGHCDPDYCRWRRDENGGWVVEPKPPPPQLPAVRYNPGVSTLEAMGLVFDWFFNQGEPIRYYGPANSLTQDVMNDPGMVEFRRVWGEAGYPVPFHWQHRADERNIGSLPERLGAGAMVYIRENTELGLAIVGLPLALNDLPPGWGPDSTIDAVGGTLGSLDLVSVDDAGDGMVRITVYNSMDWVSGTRMPGTGISIVPIKHERDLWFLPGAVLRTYFIWTEPMPRR
jgi:RHS repeat-associated protein